jgi:trans-2,3-dihydro-3-hydroxyanthranilate isomerase
VNTARLRIFTPAAELPFAGHPTVGAAALIARLRAPEVLARGGLVVVLEEEVGVVRCEVGARGGGGHVRFEAPQLPTRGDAAPDVEMLARALNLVPSDIGFGRHAPSVFSAGVEILFVPIASRAALDRAEPDASALARVLRTARVAYLYTTDTVEESAAVHARSFPNGVGIVEDPATGAAAAAFAGVAHAFEAPEDGEHEFVIEQGFRMGRPSRIIVGSRIETGRLVAVSVAGQAVGVMSGELEL